MMKCIPKAELCPNCRRPVAKHRPWCADVQTIPEPPKTGDIVDDPILGSTELISVYSRAEAIEDGVLVDCTQDPFDDLNRNAGVKFDVALTRAAFERYVEVSEEFNGSQDIKGRYWDLIFIFALAARKRADCTELLFEFISIPNGSGDWPNEKPASSSDQRLVQLKVVSGPGDRGEPCLTFMLPSED